MAKVLHGNAVVGSLSPDLRKSVSSFAEKYSRPPKLVAVLVGDDPASAIYVGRKEKLAREFGIESEVLRLSPNLSTKDVRKSIDVLNAADNVDAILVQRPLPRSIGTEDISTWVLPEKDVDVFHPLNLGRVILGENSVAPCTPTGIISILDHYEIPISGARICVVGRSPIVGKPVAALLLNRNATVTICHTKTRDLEAETRRSDIVIAAAGQAQMLGADFFSPDAVVIDVGIHRLPSGKIVGDVDFESASSKVVAISPVPGGVGPLTVFELLRNTLRLAEIRLG